MTGLVLAADAVSALAAGASEHARTPASHRRC